MAEALPNALENKNSIIFPFGTNLIKTIATINNPIIKRNHFVPQKGRLKYLVNIPYSQNLDFLMINKADRKTCFRTNIEQAI